MNVSDWYLGLFSVATGLAIAGFWGYALGTKDVPVATENRPGLGAHVAAELLTAGALLVSGVALLIGTQQRWVLTISNLSFGALAFTLIASSGYFRAKRQNGFAVAFAIGWAFTWLAIVIRLFGEG